MYLLNIRLLLAMLLLGTAIYIRVKCNELSLPILPHTSIGCIILSVLMTVNVLLCRQGAQVASSRLLWLAALHKLQTILLTILATFSALGFTSYTASRCSLSTVWQRLFSSHDAASIRRIQDALGCCGFTTVQDRAWPFPDHNSARQCREMYGREIPCGQRMMAIFRVYSIINFATLLLIGLVQLTVWIRQFYSVDETNRRYRDEETVPRRASDSMSEEERVRLLPSVVGEASNATRHTATPDNNVWGLD